MKKFLYYYYSIPCMIDEPQFNFAATCFDNFRDERLQFKDSLMRSLKWSNFSCGKDNVPSVESNLTTRKTYFCAGSTILYHAMANSKCFNNWMRIFWPKNFLPPRNHPSTPPNCGNHNTPWSFWHSVLVYEIVPEKKAKKWQAFIKQKGVVMVVAFEHPFEPGNTIITMMDSNRSIYTF